MKWLIVTSGYTDVTVGGNVIYIERFIKALIDNGHEVTLLAGTPKKDFVEHEQNGNLEIYRIFLPEAVTALRFDSKKIFTEKTRELLEKKQYDYLNTHCGFALNIDFIKNCRNKVKVIYTLHTLDFYENTFDLIKSVKMLDLKPMQLLKYPFKVLANIYYEFNTFKYSYKTVVMSNFVKDYVLKFFGKKYEDKILVTGIGITPISNLQRISKDEARTKLGIKNDETIFITVRRLAPRMGLFNLIKAFSYIKDDSSRLFIVGKGKLHNKLNDYIKKLNLQDKVTLLGYVENDLLHYYYCASDCFILPTEELEGFGISTIEALSYNLPVIGTPRGATPEILNKFDVNLITKSHLPKDIAEKINYYLKNIGNYKNLNFDKKVNEYYNWTAIVDKITGETISI